MQKKYTVVTSGLFISALMTAPYLFAESADETQNDSHDMQMSSTYCGIVPPSLQTDNFSELNFENFATTYAGTLTSELAPNASINTTTPIAPSTANLQYTADPANPHKWLFVSNVFNTGKSYTVSTDVRIDAGFLSQTSTTETGLIGAIQSYNRGFNGTGSSFTSYLDALRLQHNSTGDRVILSTRSNSTGWTSGTSTSKAISGGLQANTVYTLTLQYTNGGIVASLYNKTTGNLITQISGSSTVTPNAVGMFVDLPAVSTTPAINFSNFAVTLPASASYSVAFNTSGSSANQFVRAPNPNFVVLNRYPELGETQ